MIIPGIMSRTSAKSSWGEPDLFNDDQPDLFGGSSTPEVYVPKPEHVRNTLASLVTRMESADTWPWSPAMVRLHKQATFNNLCSLLLDDAEAESWRTRIAAEIIRLDAATEDEENCPDS